ncbi:hypothetical protein [Borreliella afzelii]|uniref:Uncharacterized protein n=2 Tax=Borreliella afzelii TaxID=29518 RepID=G0IQR2_BORAP|nr:hypothetical protein [Borreliella afzelii]AEL69298.1 conserved hypothetical protein [Borreliella afzelii PKo]AFU74335.1 hypothetical protein BafHLJ01_0069 [Borreliella afzelii HLJ01]EEC20636.1 conserved hypothetical protein [Borreliella afzelii ACA-1]APJ09024.1 hypothetical protein BLA32_03955 [Borreliella afzelii]MBB5141370.1 hypothetical protein [Borreliella afzelii]
MRFIIAFLIILNQGFSDLFSLSQDIIFESSYEIAIKKAQKLGKNVLILVGRDIKENLIKDFLNSFKNDEIIHTVSKKNVFLVIDKDNEIFNKINLQKSPTVFFVDSNNEQIKAAYVGTVLNNIQFDKDFLSYVMGAIKSTSVLKKQRNYEINTLDEKIFFYKTLKGDWRLKSYGKDRKLILFDTELKEFLVFKDIDENKLYAIPKSRVGNIYFSLLGNEEWKLFGKIK